MRIRRVPDFVIGLVFAAGGAGIIAHAAGLRAMPGMMVGSGLFPTITGAGMIGFGLLLALQSLSVFPGEPKAEPEDSGAGAGAAGAVRERLFSPYALTVLAAIGALIVAMPWAGFIVTGAVFAILIARLGGAGWIGAVLFGLLMTLGLYAVFVYGLRVPLPRGLLG